MLTDVAFTPSGSVMVSSGAEGCIAKWSMTVDLSGPAANFPVPQLPSLEADSEAKHTPHRTPRSARSGRLCHAITSLYLGRDTSYSESGISFSETSGPDDLDLEEFKLAEEPELISAVPLGLLPPNETITDLPTPEGMKLSALSR